MKKVQSELELKNVILNLPKDKKGILIKFSAQWCMPCKLMEKSMEIVKDELEKRVEVVEVDIDELGDLADKFNITAVPTLILIGKKDIKVEGDKIRLTGSRMEGAVKGEDVVRWIDSHL